MNQPEHIAEELLAKEPGHPLLPLPEPAAVLNLLRTPEGQAELAALLEYRRGVIAAAGRDPVRCELEPRMWQDVRKAVDERIRIAIILGGNRSSKSRLCGKLVMQALLEHPGTLIVCVSEDETASRETQQKILWHYLPPEIKARCHNKRDTSGVFYVNYTEANGFSERKLVLPLPDYRAWCRERATQVYPSQPSKVLFATYGEEPDDYEGLEFGHNEDWTIGWWADENLRLGWLSMFKRRGRFRPGTGLWSYTPIHGITPAIKEAVGKAARTLQWREAKLLPERVNVPGCPKGTMPYIQEPQIEGGRVFYFHSEMSPFGPGPNGTGKTYAQSVAEECAGKPSEYIQRIAYGYTSDVIGRCYPKFGAVHVVRPEELPEAGTNCVFIDPAGDRNWFILWVRVPPGSPKQIYIYREWPDVARYGEWAVPTSRAVTQDSRKGWDGERGPAQRNQGWGVTRYKQLMLAEERIDCRGGRVEPDPYRRRLWDEAVAANADLANVRELIRVRKVDPRAAKNPLASQEGGLNILTLFANEDKDGKGNIVGPRMLVLPAYTGRGIDDGISHVNELLDYNEHEPVCPVLNEPKLFVSSSCKNTIWMFENYTNMGGEEAGSKDPADLVRYIAQDDDVRHVGSEGKLATTGFKSGF